MGIQVIRSGTNWTVDVTALGLVNDTGEKDFLVVINKAEQPLAAYVKTSATVITYSGAALPANTVIDFYRWGLRDVDQLEYGEVTSQLGMNRRLTQIERVLDDLREVKQFIWSGVDGAAAVATHVGQADPHNQYRLKSAAIPELVAHVADADPHPVYTTAAELVAALTGYLPASQKGAINGLAPLDGTSKVPAINSRGCSAVYAAATGIWTFTWPDNSTQTIDTPLELVFQSVNYNNTTKLVTFTLVGGATTSFSLDDLVDLPEVQTNTTNPSAVPTTGQKLYVRIDTGEMWVANGGAWVGPYLSFTAAERTKLSGVAAGATANSTDATLLARANHTGAQAISTVTNLQSTLDGKQPIDSDLTAIAGLSNADGLIRKTSDGNATLQPISATGALSLAAANAAAGRAAIGVGALGTQDFIGQNPIVGYVANSQWANRKACVSRAIYDRLSGAHLKYGYTTAGAAANPTAVFEGAIGNYTEIPAGQTFTWSFDLTTVRFALTYPLGLFVATIYGSNTPASYTVETQDYFTGAWAVKISNTSPTLGANFTEFPTDFTNFKGLRVTVIAGSGVARVAAFEYFPFIPNNEETGTFLLSAATSNAQKVFSPIQVQNASGSNSVLIGAGTLKLNSGATITQTLTATKIAAGTNPETISVTGAAVGDVAWVSEEVPAKVTAPNTVSFNGTGLSGTIRAVVMRAQ